MLRPRTRRNFLKLAGLSAVAFGMNTVRSALESKESLTDQRHIAQKVFPDNKTITLFLCGDVMTGRGIDQVLPYSVQPRIYESFLTSAQEYVKLAEKINGPIRKPVDYSYIWGDALEEFRLMKPDVRIINLETAVTTSTEYWPGKGVNYRMHPKNISCITAAGIDCCMLANNHVLDWGYAGLTETLTTLSEAKLIATGAGQSLAEAEAPAIIEARGKGRVLVFGFGDESSGISFQWGARSNKSGVNLLPDLSEDTVNHIAAQISGFKKTDDCVVASIHWGGNWGYKIPTAHREFAHRLIDRAQVDIVHGHSSHHAKGIEVYQGKLILYGCGDFLNDYEGIRGHEEFRGDLSLMYFVSLNLTTGKLVKLKMLPMQIKRFRLNYAQSQDVYWLQQALDKESRMLNTRVETVEHGRRLALAVG